MERLTEWVGSGKDRYAIPNQGVRTVGHNTCLKKLAQYEDLEERGLIVRLPCKAGDTVWTIRGYNCYDGKCCWFNDGKCKRPNNKYCPKQIIATTYNYSMIGKTIFLTREEAEAALRKMEEQK